MWTVEAYRWTNSPNQLTWSEGGQAAGAESGLIKWTGSTLRVAIPDSDINIIIIVIIMTFIAYTFKSIVLLYWEGINWTVLNQPQKIFHSQYMYKYRSKSMDQKMTRCNGWISLV